MAENFDSNMTNDSYQFDGTLSRSEFRTSALAFADRWNKTNSAFPSWTWVSPSKQPWIRDQEDGYLSMENLRLPKLSEINCCTAPEEECSSCDSDEVVDSATLLVQSNSCQEMHHYDLHITYSSSYRVPVLYFHVYSSDGQPLALGEFEADLPVDSTEALVKSRWTFITQEEHPYLNRPWFKLHPCGNSEWIKLLFLSDVSVSTKGAAVELYLISWFSVVGPVVGLKVPLGMKMTNRENQLKLL